MKSYLLMMLLGIQLTGGKMLGFKETGVQEIDSTRRSVLSSSTNAENAIERQSVLFSWFRHMISLGVDLESLHKVGFQLAHWGPVKPENFPLIDEAYSLMEKLVETPLYITEIDGPEYLPKSKDTHTDWSFFGGSPLQSGFTQDPGPTTGDIVWKFPNGHSWYASASVEEGRVYIASPGMRTLMYCLDEYSGEVIWKTKQNGLQMYSTPRGASDVLVQDNHLVMRASSGSWEFEDNAQHIYYIDKKTGYIQRQVDANRIDYRRGYAPVTGNEDYIVFPFGRLDLRNKPATTLMQDTVVVKRKNGQRWWDLRVGYLFGEILLDKDLVFAGTDQGVLYALNLEGSDRIHWRVDIGAPIRSTPAVHGNLVIVATESGQLLGLDRAKGKILWNTPLNSGNPHAFKLFSDPLIYEGRAFIGSANKELFCIELDTGNVIWKADTTDWVRSRPFALNDKVYFATLDGRVTALQYNENEYRTLWSVQAGHHQIFAKLSGNENGLFVSTSELYLYSLNLDTGRQQWRHSLIECSYQNGERMMADIVAGGGDYQCPPTIAKGKVYVGTPSRFVFAVDAASGKEVWRFETSGQVSGAPSVYQGRVYFGQQGGNDEMYCVDAATGSPIWSSHVGWVWTTSTPDDHQVYTGTVDGKIIALDKDTGKEVWTHLTNGGVYPAPAVDDKRVYTGSWDGHYYAIDKKTGSPDWIYTTYRGLPDSAAGTIWNDRFIVRTDGELCALDLDTGEKYWAFRDPRENKGKTVMNATPSNSGNFSFVSTSIDHDGAALGAALFCIDNTTGEKLWHYTGAGGWTGSSCTENTVICGSSTESFITCLDITPNADGTPKIIWRTKIGSILEETIPAISGNKCYLLASDGYLYAFR